MYSGFIYKWTNTVNGKMYIGSHIGLDNDSYTGSGTAFKKAYSKYGASSFSRTILEYVINKEDVLTREEFYLKSMNVKNDRTYYNLKDSATGGHCTDFTNVRKGWNEWADKNLRKQVFQFDLRGNLIAKFCSLQEAGDAVGAKSPSNIKYTCDGKFTNAHGYLWSYTDKAPDVGDPLSTNGKKKVNTPDGLFQSVTEVVNFYGFSSTKMVRSRCLSKKEKWKDWSYTFNT
jgi:group I intron endonuclease